MKKIILLLILILFAGCSTSEVVKDNELAKQIIMPTATVEIQKREFVPSVLEVSVGTKVTWINKDSFGHTVNFRSATEFTQNNGIVPIGKSHSVVFNKPGSFEYIDAALAFVGVVIVT